MEKVTPISDRKSDHIRINLENDVQSGITTGLENYRYIHRALPEINLRDVDLSLQFFGRRLQAPLLISSMTGGTQEAGGINQNLAIAAQETGVAIGVGSQRAMIEHPELASTFQVRRFAPDILLFANLGAIQLNYSYGVDQCRMAVDLIEADALILHFNALQEALQPEGDTNFAGLAKQVERICRSLDVPVIAKEVGWGFSEADVRLLVESGVKAIDVAGAGGTSWSQVEMYRAKNQSQRRLAAAFQDWGIPTAEAIQITRRAAKSLMVIASGGLRSGLDIAKCLSLGASIGGMAGPFLKAAASSVEDTILAIRDLQLELQVCMFITGAQNLNELANIQLEKIR
jgi:isopentenyl-diphosphate Delta-isomerase